MYLSLAPSCSAIFRAVCISPGVVVMIARSSATIAAPTVVLPSRKDGFLSSWRRVRVKHGCNEPLRGVKMFPNFCAACDFIHIYDNIYTPKGFIVM